MLPSRAAIGLLKEHVDCRLDGRLSDSGGHGRDGWTGDWVCARFRASSAESVARSGLPQGPESRVVRYDDDRAWRPAEGIGTEVEGARV